MLKFKSLFCLVPNAILFNLLIANAPSQANCADQIANLQKVQPAMERHWQQLQQQKTYPWGEARPYGKLNGDRITLTSAFDRLTTPQKEQVLNTLLSYTLTPQEQQDSSGDYIGAPPFKVYANDGRAVSMPYDGCTRFTLLTERARYGYYYNTVYGFNRGNSILEQLRNSGRPSWREVRFPISAAEEKKTRLQFWNVIGWKTGEVWWIAWVPENGYFEINIPVGYQQSRLQRFWQIAPRQYRYVVVANDGRVLLEKKF
ncbi:phosphoribosylaminoimidazolesuccinocarboxamide synthase [Calothrix sp. NIES-2098]|uniref:phosphoribosylaminoimidazolesuccinocarboxamide synthase n=1 Tax=Calothrix sp. NIES-2098 TaxID=1954171 RepID=UPI000B62078D|nr:hypothetical protein NIES2098_65590 [Calothrix sp. NIES-2098]